MGSTLVCNGLANGSLHFGTQLSYSIVTKPFDLDNQGKFHQVVTWERDPEVKKSVKAIFSFTPAKITMPPHTPFSFKVTGSYFSNNLFHEYMVVISVELVSSLFIYLFIYFTILGICNEDFTFFDTSMVWIFDSIFFWDTIWVYIPCNNLHTEVKSL